MSSRTLNMVRARLRSVFAQGVVDQLIYVNPVAAVKRVKPEHDEEDKPGLALEPEQSARLYEIGEALFAAGVCRLWPAIFTALCIGLRRGEVMGLRWEDVDFDANTVCVRQNLTEVKGVPTIGKPKTKNAVRDIPMPSSLKAILEAHRDAMAREAVKLGKVWRASGPVFATEEGAYTAPSHLRRSLVGVLEWSNPESLKRQIPGEPGKWRLVTFEQRLRAIPTGETRARLEAIVRSGKALPQMRVHDLRHTAGTKMLRRKMPIEAVSRILGHANISITYDVYRHVSEREIRSKMVDLFDHKCVVKQGATVFLN